MPVAAARSRPEPWVVGYPGALDASAQRTLHDARHRVDRRPDREVDQPVRVRRARARGRR